MREAGRIALLRFPQVDLTAGKLRKTLSDWIMTG